MAQILPNINPNDLDARRAITFDLNFKPAGVFLPIFFTKDQVRVNLINWFLTNKGERVMNPDFGGDLRSLLFDSIEDTSSSIQERIQDDISTFFPSVEIIQIDISPTPDENSINFVLNYSISELGFQDTINIRING